MNPRTRCADTAILAALITIAVVGGPSPTSADDDDATSKPLVLNPITKKPWMVWVAYEGFEPLKKPGSTKKKPSFDDLMSVAPLKFMTPCYFTECSPDYVSPAPGEIADPEAFIHICRSDASGKVADLAGDLGWVPLKYVVTDKEACRNEFAIHRKRLLVNMLEYVNSVKKNAKRNGDSGSESLVPVRSRPGSAEPAKFKRETYSLMNIFFEYGFSKEQNGEEYVLIGTATAFITEKNSNDDRTGVSDVIRGWVPANRTMSWDTRDMIEWDASSTQTIPPPGWPEKLEWKRRTEKGIVYQLKKDAYAELRPGTRTGAGLFDEVFKPDGTSFPFPLNQPRYPILDFNPHTVKVRLYPDGPLFKIDVSINGRPPERMLMDTGASLISLPADIARRCGVDTTNGRDIEVTVADGRTVKAKRVVLSRVKVGTRTEPDVECVVLPEAPNASPLLGMSFLGRFNLTSDANAKTVSLVPKFNGASNPDGKDDDWLAEKDPTGNRLLRVSGIGGLYKEGKQVLSADQLAALQEKLRKLEASLAFLQVLIVIDHTGSMEFHYPAVASFVESLAGSLKDRKKGTTSIAVSYYDDSTDHFYDLEKPDYRGLRNTGPGYVANPMRPLDDDQARAALIADIRAKGQNVFGGVSVREEVFQGITKAIDAAGFDENPDCAKLVVVIGDYPDHSNEDDPKHLGESMIVEKLLAGGRAPIEFHAVQVIDPEAKVVFANNQIGQLARPFKKQMDTIISKLKERSGLDLGGYETLGLQQNVATVPLDSGGHSLLTTRLSERYRKLETEAAGMRDDLKNKAVGLPTVVSEERKQRFKDAGIDLDLLDGTQLCHEGYVWEYARGQEPVHGRNGSPGVRQIRQKVLLTRSDLIELKNAMKELFPSPDDETVNDPVKAVKVLVEKASGESGSSGSFETAELRRRGLKFQSTLLSKASSQVNAELDRLEIPKIMNRRQRLNDILEGEVNKPSVVFNWRELKEKQPSGELQSQFVKIGAAKKEQRFFQFPGPKVVYCWVDVEEEMP